MIDHTEFLKVYLTKFNASNKVLSSFFKNVIVGNDGKFYIVIDKFDLNKDSIYQFVVNMSYLYLYTKLVYVGKLDIILKNEQMYESLDLILAIIKEAFDYSCFVTIHTTSQLINKYIEIFNAIGFNFNSILVSVKSQYEEEYFNNLIPEVKCHITTGYNYYDLEKPKDFTESSFKICNNNNLVWNDNKIYPCLLAAKFGIDNNDYYSIEELLSMMEGICAGDNKLKVEALCKLIYLRKDCWFSQCPTCKFGKEVV